MGSKQESHRGPAKGPKAITVHFNRSEWETLRDLFAMAALAGLTARGTVGAANAAWGAETAYLFADAMLKAREIK